MEQTTSGSDFQNRGGSRRNSAPSGEAGARPNFSISSPFHWETSEGGVRISALPTRPRIQYSFNTRQASMVLPKPTSSANSARPLKWRSTLRRSEEHTSELQSLRHLVCRLLLEKKK